jgi:uncharacterized protein (DUF302 family)
VLLVAGGFASGLLLAVLAVWAFMPGLMIVTHPSSMGFDDTVSAIEESLRRQGWVSSGTLDMQASLARHGRSLGHRVKIVKLCQPDYAVDVLATDRHVASLMPCSIAIWEDDGGRVFLSKMNTGLMGKLFGGNIARVMGQHVARDEKAILSAVLAQGS